VSSLQDNPDDGDSMLFETFVDFFHSAGHHIPKHRLFFVAVRISNQTFVILTVILMNCYMPFTYQ